MREQFRVNFNKADPDPDPVFTGLNMELVFFLTVGSGTGFYFTDPQPGSKSIKSGPVANSTVPRFLIVNAIR